jgi:hypothetical protein
MDRDQGLVQGVSARLKPEDRKFIVTVATAFAIMGAVLLWRDRQTAAIVAGALGMALALLGLVAPRAVAPVRFAWMKAAHAMSRVTTPIILGIVYFLVVTPTGLVRRLSGHASLKSANTNETAWTVREVRARPPADMKRQF